MAKRSILNPRLLFFASSLWAASALPVAFADKICRTDSSGKEICKNRIPDVVKIAIGATILAVIVLSIALFFIIRHIRSKRASAAAVEIYAPDAVQISSHTAPTTYGPPPPVTFAGAGGTPHMYPGSADPDGSFHRQGTSGFSASRGAGAGNYTYNPSPKYPAQSYPFTGFGSQAPQSAYAGGYPGPSHGLPNTHKDGSPA